jgi:phage FluMu protein Com
LKKSPNFWRLLCLKDTWGECVWETGHFVRVIGKIVMINAARRNRMRSFIYGRVPRQWTTLEMEWLRRSFMEGRAVRCPVCDTMIELAAVDKIAYLRCPGCKNSNEPQLRPTRVLPRQVAV